MRGDKAGQTFSEADYGFDDADGFRFSVDAGQTTPSLRQFRRRVRPQTSMASWKGEEEASGAGRWRLSTTQLVLLAFVAISLLVVVFFCCVFAFVAEGVIVRSVHDILRFVVFFATLIFLPLDA